MHENPTVISASVRTVEDWDLSELIRVCDDMMKCYLELKSITALSQRILLRLKIGNIKDESI